MGSRGLGIPNAEIGNLEGRAERHAVAIAAVGALRRVEILHGGRRHHVENTNRASQREVGDVQLGGRHLRCVAALLQLAKDRLERVRVDIDHAVGGARHFLRQGKRRQLPVLVDQPVQGNPSAAHLGLVDILGTDRVVDVTGVGAAEGRHAQGHRVIGERDIQCHAAGLAGAAFLDRAATQRHAALQAAEVRWRSDIAHHATHGAGAVQRALRTLEHFNPLQVGRVNVRRHSAARGIRIDRANRCFVNIEGSARCRLCHAGGDAAQCDLGKALAERGQRQAWYLRDVVFQLDLAVAGQLFCRDSTNRSRHIDRCLFALLRRDDDFVDGLVDLSLLGMGRNRAQQGSSRSNRGQGELRGFVHGCLLIIISECFMRRKFCQD